MLRGYLSQLLGAVKEISHILLYLTFTLLRVFISGLIMLLGGLVQNTWMWTQLRSAHTHGFIVSAVVSGIAIYALLPDQAPQHEANAPILASSATEGQAAPTILVEAALVEEASSAITSDVQAVVPKTEVERQFTLKRGEAFVSLLERTGLKRPDAYAMANRLGKFINARKLQPGMQVKAVFEPNELKHPTSLIIRDRFDREVIADTTGGEIKARSAAITTVDIYDLVEGEISSSLYEDATRAGLPDAVFAQMVKLFSYDVDFQRDIRAGTKFKIYYQRQVAESYGDMQEGPILLASLELYNRTVTLGRFEDDNGEWDYYTPDGKNIRKALMKTPINGARLTSRFGKRRHPVLGYMKTHKGLDFGAPRGTPIFAAGDGVVERASRYGAYGNYLRIRHGGGLKTAYAHMKGYGRGIRSGVRVKQGQIVGYVGTTGRSTGPHLHYEILKNGVQVNPFTLKIPAGKALPREKMPAFTAQLASADEMINSIMQYREAVASDQSPTAVPVAAGK